MTAQRPNRGESPVNPGASASGHLAKAERLREIASSRLEAVRAMQALVREEPRVLAAVDAAGRGEIPDLDAEAALEALLAAREACIAELHSCDGEWSLLASTRSEWAVAGAPAGVFETTRAIADEIGRILAEIESSDARFAVELSTRRAAARLEMSRADGARAAGRAYAPQRAVEPRFTDRRG
jgi:hypothetical protein